MHEPQSRYGTGSFPVQGPRNHSNSWSLKRQRWLLPTLGLALLMTSVGCDDGPPTPADEAAKLACERLEATYADGKVGRLDPHGLIANVYKYETAEGVTGREYVEALVDRCGDIMEDVGTFETDEAIAELLSNYTATN